MGNGAIQSNPRVAEIDLTVAGSDFLWAIFATMLASGLGLTFWTLSLRPGQRAFHFLGVSILFTASVAYFSLASDLGATPIAVEFVRNQSDLYTGPDPDPTRSIWYVRCKPSSFLLEVQCLCSITWTFDRHRLGDHYSNAPSDASTRYWSSPFAHFLHRLHGRGTLEALFHDYPRLICESCNRS